MYDNSSRVMEVDINEILPNRFQPRIQFDEEEILELSDSIKEHGVIQPLVVRTIGDKYEIIAGERRYKASVLAGKETVPVIVKNLNDKDSAEIALIENIQRKNLTPIEEALSYKKILDMGYITQENLASKLGKSQSSVANKIRLLNLSDEVQEALLENKISERHARSLLKLSTSKLQNEMLNRIVNERLTVRKTDEEIEKIKNNISDESDDNSQKIVEKGEIDMNNNNMFGMPNIPQNPQPAPNFDIFGTGPQQPVVNTQVQETPVVSPTPSFDIFGGSTPIQPEVPQVTSVPEVPSVAPVNPIAQEFSQPAMPNMPAMGGIEFDANGNVVSAPTMESVPVQPELPQVTSVPEVPSVAPVNPVAQEFSQPAMPNMPAMGGIEFDANGNVVSAPTIESVPVQPELPQVTLVPEVPSVAPVNPVAQEFSQPTMPNMPMMVGTEINSNGNVISTSTIEPSVPQTAPIIESPIMENTTQMTQQSENLFSFGDSNVNPVPVQPTTSSIPEFKMPEPIIVTDYSKQYDPVMPEIGPVAPTVDFKEVISAIRECSNKIEKYGFKIDVEEYDLTNLYQVIFKIEK